MIAQKNASLIGAHFGFCVRKFELLFGAAVTVRHTPTATPKPKHKQEREAKSNNKITMHVNTELEFFDGGFISTMKMVHGNAQFTVAARGGMQWAASCNDAFRASGSEVRVALVRAALDEAIWLGDDGDPAALKLVTYLGDIIAMERKRSSRGAKWAKWAKRRA